MAKVLVFSEDTLLLRQMLAAAMTVEHEALLAVTLDGVDTSGAGDADRVVKLKGSTAWQEDYAEGLADFVKQESIDLCLIAGSFRGKNIAAQTAAMLGAGLVSAAQSLKVGADGVTTTRLIYGGLAVAEEKTSFPAFVTIDPQTFAAHESAADHAVEILEAATGNAAIENIQNIPIEHDGVDIAAADRIVAVGRGLEKQEDLKEINILAEKIKAEVGCSRGIAEDYHWLPLDRYVGISGKKVKPDIYLTVGISGQVQHVAGIRDSRIIAAIDINENAPIFSVADYGIVGDFKEIVPLLLQNL